NLTAAVGPASNQVTHVTDSKPTRTREGSMEAKFPGTSSHITRRTILAGGAALAATPVLAEECRIGPPQHHKGPVVFMDYDQVDLDASTDRVSTEPLIARVAQRLASNSEAARARIGPPRRVAYGPT